MALLEVLLLTWLTMTTQAQTPSAGPADPGPLVVDPGTGLSTPPGYRITEIADVAPFLGNGAFDMIVGPGGDLFLTPVVTPGSPNHIFRIPMNGVAPAQPLSVQQYTTQPANMLLIAHDPVGGDIFGTSVFSAMSTEVFRVPASGTPQSVFSGLNDPCDLTIGQPSWSSTPRVFVAVQGGLVHFDGSASSPTLQSVNADFSQVSASGYGNWGAMAFDPSTDELIGGFIGFPNPNNTVAIPIPPGGSVVTVTQAALDLDLPRGLDTLGERLFSSGPSQLGYVNASGFTFVPLVASLGGSFSPVVANAPGGGLFVLDGGGTKIYHLERTLESDRLEVASMTGGVVNFDVSAGVVSAGSPYRLFLSVSGSSPGIPFGATVIPLNPDPLTTLIDQEVSNGNPGLAGWDGLLDASGSASALLGVPPLIPGIRFSICGIVISPLAPTNAVWFHIV